MTISRIPVPPRRAHSKPPTIEEVVGSEAFARPRVTFATGIDQLDKLLRGGIVARQVTVFAAPPGAGKTQLNMELARRLRRYCPVLYIGTELEVTEAAARYVGMQIGVPAADLLAHLVRPADALAKLREQEADAGDVYPIHFVFMDTYDEEDPLGAIEEYAETLRADDGAAPIVIVDYLQMLAVEDGDGRRMSVSRAASGLRRLAQKLDTAIIATSSVGRAFYGKAGPDKWTDEDDPIAWLAAGKESGDIEFAAAVFVYVDTQSECDAEGAYLARLIVAKARGGRKGFAGMRFDGRLGRWDEDAKVVGEIKAKRAKARRSKAEKQAKDKDTADEASIRKMEGALLEVIETKEPLTNSDKLIAIAQGEGARRTNKLAAWARLEGDRRIGKGEGRRGHWYSARQVAGTIAWWLRWVAGA